MDGKLQYCQYMSAGCAHTVYVPTSSGCCVLLLQISSCVLGGGGGGGGIYSTYVSNGVVYSMMWFLCSLSTHTVRSSM